MAYLKDKYWAPSIFMCVNKLLDLVSDFLTQYADDISIIAINSFAERFILQNI